MLLYVLAGRGGANPLLSLKFCVPALKKTTTKQNICCFCSLPVPLLWLRRSPCSLTAGGFHGNTCLIHIWTVAVAAMWSVKVRRSQVVAVKFDIKKNSTIPSCHLRLLTWNLSCGQKTLSSPKFTSHRCDTMEQTNCSSIGEASKYNVAHCFALLCSMDLNSLELFFTSIRWASPAIHHHGNAVLRLPGVRTAMVGVFKTVRHTWGKKIKIKISARSAVRLTDVGH